MYVCIFLLRDIYVYWCMCDHLSIWFFFVSLFVFICLFSCFLMKIVLTHVANMWIFVMMCVQPSSCPEWWRVECLSIMHGKGLTVDIVWKFQPDIFMSTMIAGTSRLCCFYLCPFILLLKALSLGRSQGQQKIKTAWLNFFFLFFRSLKTSAFNSLKILSRSGWNSVYLSDEICISFVS